MKWAFLLSLLALLALSAAQPADAEDRVLVRYWYAMNDRQSAQLQALIPTFQAAHPTVAIEATRFDYAQFREVLLRSIVAGTFPDVARIDSLWLAELADIEALTPLDETMPDFTQLAAGFFPGPLATNRWHGHIWGLPQDTNTEVLFYDRRQFEQAGLEAPQTVDDFVGMACALTDGRGHFGVALSGTSFWTVAPLFYTLGGQVTDPEGTTASGYVDGAASRRAFETLVQLYDAGCLAPAVLGIGPDILEGFTGGQYRMIFEGPEIAESLQNTFPGLDVGLALVPAGPNESSSVVGGSSIVLIADSSHRNAALQWMRFLVSEDAQRTMAQTGALPTLRSLLGDDRLPRYMDPFMRQLETARARLPHVQVMEIDHVLSDTFRSMLLRQETVSIALSHAAGRINTLLSE